MKQYVLMLFALLFLCAAPDLPAEGDSSSSNAVEGKVSGFTFVLPGKDGGKQCIVRGDTANFLPDGVIEITNVKTQVFRDGGSDIFITSSKGMFNKGTREVTTDKEVEILSQEMLIKGTGLFWNPEENRAQIQKNVSVKIYSKPSGTDF